MLKRFDRVIENILGQPMTATGDDKSPFTVAAAIVEALGSSFEDEKNLGGVEKLKRTILAERIQRSGKTPTQVEAEDLTLIKALVAKRWPTF
ncbi:MAG: hypothetical protein PHS14_21090, partial [Elusimicrobia bacterium]|nr:hypothetical protein [Elusimicrobiota bacterium]